MANCPARVAGILAVINLVAVAFCAYAYLSGLMVDVDVRMQFVRLDREGVINTEALGRFDPSWTAGESNLGYRNTVPRYIAGPALQAERRNALLALTVASGNFVACAGYCVSAIRARRRMATASQGMS